MPSASQVPAQPIMYIGTSPSGHLLTYAPHSWVTTCVRTPILPSCPAMASLTSLSFR
jgi:hypothetical protein